MSLFWWTHYVHSAVAVENCATLGRQKLLMWRNIAVWVCHNEGYYQLLMLTLSLTLTTVPTQMDPCFDSPLVWQAQCWE